MRYVIHTYSAYDPKVWGIPWAAPVNAEGRPDFKSAYKAHFSGSKGSGGDLFVEDPWPGAVWVYGQKQYRSPRSDKNYAVFHKSLLGGKFADITPEELVDALNAFEKTQKKPRTAVAAEAPVSTETPPKKPAEKKRIVHSISLSLKEDEQVRRRAAAAGMEIGPFIKAQALRGKVRGYRLQVVTEHSEAIGAIAADIHRLVNAPHPDRWLYETDLEEIQGLQKKLLQVETTILEHLKKGLQ